LIRSGQALEALAGIDTIIFDKTATLTEGRAAISSIQTIGPKVSAQVVLTLAASAEQALGHPIAESIVRYAHDHEIEIRPCSDWQYHPGLGVEATIDGAIVTAGNRRYMTQIGIDQIEENGWDCGLETETHVYIAVNGTLIGIITCSDPLRSNAGEIITELQAQHITALMVSGDSQAVSAVAAQKIGIAPENVYAEVLPKQKLEIVKSLQAEGRRVAFVGDGVNDAAAMAHADVALTLGSATDLALENAGIVLTTNDLQELLTARAVACHAMRIIQQNKALVVVPNIAGIAYASLAFISPVAGVVLNNGSAALAALNSLRPLVGPKTSRNKLETNKTNQPKQQKAGVKT
jgi:Cu2+-exporting ATPase